MTFNIPRSAVVFSAKNFLAGMLALYIALRSGLENPAWSVVTAYIVAQPHAGASISKATYRVCGTVAGACAAVLMVPPLVQMPALLNAGIALWLGVCVAVSVADRTPRSYMFALAGYTSCIIIFPILTHPQDVFEYAVARAQEISIGIVCSAMVHAIVLPVSTAPLLRRRIHAALEEVRAVCLDALATRKTERRHPDRQRLAVAINEMHDLLLHLSFEGHPPAARLRAIRAILTNIERVIPLSLAVTDRIDELAHHEALDEDLRKCLEQVRHWFAMDDPARQLAEASSVLDRCAALRPPPDRPLDWPAALRYSLLERTAELVHQQASIARLHRFTGDKEVPLAAADTPFGVDHSPRQRIDRDWRGAAGAGLATALTVSIADALWMASGWLPGYSAVMMAGVYFAVYSGTPNPAQMLKNKFVGVILRLLLGIVYAEAILPAVSNFEGLVLVLAPALLIIGIMMATPRLAAISFNFVVGIFSPSIVDRTLHVDFQTYLNAGMATLLGIYYAMLMVTATRFLWVDGLVRRTLSAGRRDIASLRYIAGPLPALWRSRMAHRVGLLAPRMAALPDATGGLPGDALRDMMTGGSLAQLHAASLEAPETLRSAVQSLIGQVADHYRRLRRSPSLAPPDALRRQIDGCLAQAAAGPRPKPGAVLALTSLRRNLFPDDHSIPASM